MARDDRDRLRPGLRGLDGDRDRHQREVGFLELDGAGRIGRWPQARPPGTEARLQLGRAARIRTELDLAAAASTIRDSDRLAWARQHADLVAVLAIPLGAERRKILLAPGFPLAERIAHGPASRESRLSVG